MSVRHAAAENALRMAVYALLHAGRDAVDRHEQRVVEGLVVGRARAARASRSCACAAQLGL